MSNVVYSAPPGLAAARYFKAIAFAGNGGLVNALAYAEGQRNGPWANTPSVPIALKAAVDAMSTGNAAALSAPRVIVSDFMSLVRERSLLDRIPGFRRAPLNVSMLAVAGDATAHIVAEGVAKPLSKFSTARVTVAPRKITAACVVTDELLRFSSGLAEVSLGSELAKAVGLQMDRRFIDPDVANSISNGATVISSSGSSLAAIDSDLKAMFAVFATQDSALDAAVFCMSSTTAVYLASLRGTGGNPAFPNITARGGFLLGIPVYISGALIASGSPGEGAIVLFDPAQILVGDEGQMDVTIARNANVQLSDTPDSPPTGSTVEISLFQANLLALRAERWCGWARQAATSVAVLDNVQY